MGAMLPRARAGAGENRERVLALFPRLAERARQPAGTLSGGEQQMLAIGRCLMGAPQLIMFDEPSLGLAPGHRPRRARHDPRPQSRWHHLSVGRAECGAVAEARQPRLCFGKRARHAYRQRRRIAGRRPRTQRLSRIVMRLRSVGAADESCPSARPARRRARSMARTGKPAARGYMTSAARRRFDLGKRRGHGASHFGFRAAAERRRHHCHFAERQSAILRAM